MTQILCDKDMNYCRITLCDLRGLIIKERGTLGKVTIEGHDLFVLPLYSKEDIVYDLTEEGHYRGYAALFSRKTKEIFLWHLVEMARKYDDGNVMFPEKVRIPAFSLESLVRISDKSATLDKWKNWWFTCSYKVTRNRVSRALFENAVQALREPRTCIGTKNYLVPIPKEYFKKTPKEECLINLSSLPVRKGVQRKLQYSMEVRREHYKRFRIRNGKVYSLH